MAQRADSSVREPFLLAAHGRRGSEIASLAITAVRQQRSHLESAGVSRSTFLCGVVYTIVTVFCVGRWPQHYWLLHTASAVVMLPLRTYRTVGLRRSLDMLEFCWVSNYLILGLSLMLVVLMLWPQHRTLPSDERVTWGWRVFFMVAAGPLGGAVPAMGNALIFHSFDNIVPLPRSAAVSLSTRRISAFDNRSRSSSTSRRFSRYGASRVATTMPPSTRPTPSFSTASRSRTLIC